MDLALSMPGAMTVKAEQGGRGGGEAQHKEPVWKYDPLLHQAKISSSMSCFCEVREKLDSHKMQSRHS